MQSISSRIGLGAKNFAVKAVSLLLLSLPFTVNIAISRVQAEPIAAPDGTGTLVDPNGRITGGQLSGDGTNLFHSFIKFGLTKEEVANFDLANNNSILNILGRVIGGNPSVIDGMIKVTNGQANLYLMNPSGIIFGANARLDVLGAFTATTANGIGFGSGWFNAVGENNYAALVGSPTSFAFTMAQPGAIANFANLEVKPGHNLTFVGGTVLSTGNLTAPAGQINVTAVPGKNLVRISQANSVLSLEIEPLNANSSQPNTWNLPIASLPELLTEGKVSNAGGVTPEPGGAVLTGNINVSGTEAKPDAGKVNIQAASITTGDIEASGLSNAEANRSLNTNSNASSSKLGGNGGEVVLKATSGSVITRNIDALGGEGGKGHNTRSVQSYCVTSIPGYSVPCTSTEPADNGANGGKGGLIELIASESIVAQNINARGGTGGSGGTGRGGGGVAANGSDTSSPGEQIATNKPTITGNISTTGNTGGTDGISGTSGTVSTSGRRGGGLAANGPGTANPGEKAANEPTITGNISAIGNTGGIGGRGGTGGTGGEVILTANSDSIKTANITTTGGNGGVGGEGGSTDRGGNGGNGGTAGQIVLKASESIVAGDITAQGGVGNTGGTGGDGVSSGSVGTGGTGGQGGAGNQVVLTANSRDITIENITATGGTGGNGGSGGNAYLFSPFDGGKGGNGNAGGAGGQVQIKSEYGNVRTGNIFTTSGLPGSPGLGGLLGGYIADPSFNLRGTTGTAGTLGVNAGSLNLSGRSVTTGTIDTSASNGADVFIQSTSQITTQGITTRGFGGKGGNVTLDPPGDIQVGFIDTRGATQGGNVNITTGRFFRATGLISDLNTPTSISTADGGNGGNIIIQQGGGMNDTPFVIGNSTINGTRGNIITRSNILGIGESYIDNVTRGNIQVNTSKTPPRGNKIPRQPLTILPPCADAGISALEGKLIREYEKHIGADLAGKTLVEACQVLHNIQLETGVKPAIVYITFVPEKEPENKNRNVASTEDKKDDTDQLEIVLVTAKGKPIYKRFEKITRKMLKEANEEFKNGVNDEGLSDFTNYKEPSQKLYEWLIRPIEKEYLEPQKINNLTFILDTDLLSMPLAALQDGKLANCTDQRYKDVKQKTHCGFLIERYSVGLMPSLSLTDTRYLNIRNTQVLAMGTPIFTNVDFASKPLPTVPKELEIIKNRLKWKGEVLLQDKFTISNLKKERGKSYGIVHLSTHGELKPGEFSNSFIQFWGDERLKLNDIRNLGFDNPAVELLVLSACRTAKNSKDAELGFGGLATSAGVKSALAGLWYVNTDGTLGLMTEFYQQLKTAPIKADALRQAQLAMLQGKVKIDNSKQILTWSKGDEPLGITLKHDDLSHPYFWSGFTMIGSPW